MQNLLVAAIRQQEGRLVSLASDLVPHCLTWRMIPHPLFNLTIPKLVPYNTLLVCLWLMHKFNEEVAGLIQFMLYDI
jgi:hypothetical protein